MQAWLVPSPKLVSLVLSDAGRASLEALRKRQSPAQRLGQLRAVDPEAEVVGRRGACRVF